MSNCNPLPTLIVEKLNFKSERSDFISNPTNIIAYKKFTEAVQQFVYQTWSDIIQTITELNQYNVKPMEECQKVVIYPLRYLKRTKKKGIRYTNGYLISFGYSNSN